MIDLTPMLEIVLSLAAAGITAAISWASKYVAKKTNSDALKSLTEQLEGFLMQGVKVAKQEALDAGKDAARIKTDSQVIESAARFAMNQAPVLMKQAGVDEDWVKRQVQGLLKSM